MTDRKVAVCSTCKGVGRISCPGPAKEGMRRGRATLDWCWGMHMGHNCPDCHPSEATDD